MIRALVAIFLLSLAPAAWPEATAPQAAARQSADDEIHDKVMQRLANDRDVKGGGIEVDVTQGVVTLKGKVRESKQKTKAEHLARKVKGVKSVVNNLQVEMPSGRK